MSDHKCKNFSLRELVCAAMMVRLGRRSCHMYLLATRNTAAHSLAFSSAASSSSTSMRASKCSIWPGANSAKPSFPNHAAAKTLLARGNVHQTSNRPCQCPLASSFHHVCTCPSCGCCCSKSNENESERGWRCACTHWVQPLIESGSRLLSKLLHSSKHEVVLFCPRMTEGKQRLARQHVVQWRAHE